jgi:hypothetical protein
VDTGWRQVAELAQRWLARHGLAPALAERVPAAAPAAELRTEPEGG